MIFSCRILLFSHLIYSAKWQLSWLNFTLHKRLQLNIYFKIHNQNMLSLLKSKTTYKHTPQLTQSLFFFNLVLWSLLRDRPSTLRLSNVIFSSIYHSLIEIKFYYSSAWIWKVSAKPQWKKSFKAGRLNHRA